MNRNAAATLALAAGLAASPAFAGDFVDTRLSFVFADDNLLARSGETTPNSPNVGFGAGPQNNQFYDNFNTKFSGFETLSNVSLYKSMPSFFDGLTTEAAFNLLVLERPSGGIDFRDNSSYIRLVYKPGSWGATENVSLTGFPVSADRFRLGYAYKITWGGDGVFTSGARQFGVPGVKLQMTRDRYYLYGGMKTALLLNPLIKEVERQYGFLLGGGVDVTPFLRVEANGGYFQKGLIPGLANQNIEAPVTSAGGSAEIVLHQGAPVGVSVDLKLYKNDPEAYEKLFRPEVYPGGVSYTVSLEVSHLVQTLEDPDVFARTVPQNADAVALQGRLKVDYLRFNVLALYRTLSFLQFEVPGFPSYTDFPDASDVRPEVWGAVGVDYNLPRFHLTPGLILGVQMPASVRPPESFLPGGGNNPPAGLTGGRTTVMRDVNSATILPSDASVLPIYSAKMTFRWDLSESVAAIGEVFYTRDPNRTTFKDDVTGIAQPSFEKEDALGFNTMLQARF